MSERKWRPLFLSYLLRQRALVISIGALIGLATLLFVSTLLLTSPPVLAQDGNQLFLPIISGGGAAPTPGPTPGAPPVANDEYVVLGWNDLGMHCYNRDFQNLAVLPPYNNLWAQVIK
ncbi:MAG TPA: hypothetical protein PL187_10635, partial [Caldilinea sp.]|nr:hypothetical protein [Caldilinea sp.]